MWDSQHPEENTDVEESLRMIVTNLDNLVRSLRNGDLKPESLNIGRSYDVDKILTYYRESNHPLTLNVGGLRFRYLCYRN